MVITVKSHIICNQINFLRDRSQKSLIRWIKNEEPNITVFFED